MIEWLLIVGLSILAIVWVRVAHIWQQRAESFQAMLARGLDREAEGSVHNDDATFSVTWRSQHGPVAVVIFPRGTPMDSARAHLDKQNEPILVGVIPQEQTWEGEAAYHLRRIGQMLYDLRAGKP